MKLSQIIFILTMMPLVVFSKDSINLQQARQMAIERNRKIQIDALERESASLQTRSSFNNYLPRFDAEAGYLRRNKSYQLFDGDKFLPVIPWQGINPQTGAFDPAIFHNPDLAPNMVVVDPNTGEVIHDAQGNPVFRNYAWLPAEEGKIGQKNNYSFGISVRQPLYTGGKISSGYQIAQKAEHIARAQSEQSISEVVFRTDELFWQVIALEEKSELTHAYLQMLGQLVTDLETLYEEGIITHNRVLQAQVKYNEVELMKLQAENALRLSRMALNQHIGVPFAGEYDLDRAFEPDILTLDGEMLTEKAIQQRAEIQILNEAVAIANELVHVNRADMFPSVGLIAEYTYVNPNPYNGFNTEFGGDYTIGIGVSIPIYHFGERRRQVALARIEHQKIQLQKEEAAEMITLQVSQSLKSLGEARNRRELSALSMQQAHENLEITQNLFAEGRATTRDVLEAQAYWQEAREADIFSRNEEMMAFSRLQKNIGELQKIR